MTSYRNQKKKLKESYEQTEKTENSLNKKLQSFSHKDSVNDGNRIPTILHDSDWIEPGYLEGMIIIGNQNVYLSYGSSSRLENQETPFSLDYDVDVTLDIPDEFIANVRPSILIEKPQETTIQGVIPFQRYKTSSDYWKILGDATTIYKGTSPSKGLFPETDRVNGDFSASLASKWFYGTITYTDGGNSYELRNGYIDRIRTYWDVVPLAGHPGYFSWKYFDCIALDGISSSAVNGTGTYIVNTAYEDGGGNPQNSTVTTRNVTMTATIFENTTILYASGSLYKDSVYQGFYPYTNPITINFAGDLGGTAVMSTFSYSWLSPNNFWKLFYSSYRAVEFDFNVGTRIFGSLPETGLYESGTLPYSHLYVDENPDDYPEIEQDSAITWKVNSRSMGLNKIKSDRYQIRLKGTIYFQAPATVSNDTTANFVDERYSPSGNTYSRDSENRDPKTVNYYTPLQTDIKFRWLLIWISPLEYESEKQYRIT